jgi:hypothetical protein
MTCTVTLARLDRSWRKSVATDNVGCMLGFYVLRGTEVDIKNVCAETPFLSGHENSAGAYARANGYNRAVHNYVLYLPGTIIRIKFDIQVYVHHIDN